MLEITHLPLLMGPGAGTTATARTTFSLTVVDLRTEDSLAGVSLGSEPK